MRPFFVKMKQLLLYFPLDDPEILDQDKLAETYLKHHATVIEVALPVKNPVLDGPIIRESMARILSVKTCDEVFEDIGLLKRKHPKLNIQVMAYSSIINEYGIEEFSKKIIRNNVSYVLSPDADEDLVRKLDEAFKNTDISVIRFAPFVVTENEIDLLKEAKGYIFQRSTDGKTGKSQDLPLQLKENINLLHKSGVTVPIVIGFGISCKSQVEQAFMMNADGVVIGSALFNRIKDGTLDEYLGQFDEFYK